MTWRGKGPWLRLVLVGLALLAWPGGRSDAGGATGEDPNDLRWDLAERFKATADSVELSSRITGLAKGGRTGRRTAERTLAVEVKLDILDANGLVAMYVDNPVVLSASDEGGDRVRWKAGQPNVERDYVEVKPVTAHDETTTFRTVQPAGMVVRLRLTRGQTVPSMLSSLKWYVYALYADRKVEADVPFAVTAPTRVKANRLDVPLPDEGWMDVGHDLQARVLRADSYPPCAILETEVRSNQGSVRSLEVSPVYGVGDFVVLSTQLGDPNSPVFAEWPWQAVVNQRSQAALCLGRYDEHSRAKTPIMFKTVRHLIAINPREVKIPFELKNIRIPSVEPPAR